MGRCDGCKTELIGVVLSRVAASTMPLERRIGCRQARPMMSCGPGHEGECLFICDRAARRELRPLLLYDNIRTSHLLQRALVRRATPLYTKDEAAAAASYCLVQVNVPYLPFSAPQAPESVLPETEAPNKTSVPVQSRPCASKSPSSMYQVPVKPQ